MSTDAAGMPAFQLFEYVSSLMRDGASAWDLHLTVLVKGARGSGKPAVVSSVAPFHCLQVSLPSFPFSFVRFGTGEADDKAGAAGLFRRAGGDRVQD